MSSYKFATVHQNDAKGRTKHKKMVRRLREGKDLSKTKWLRRATRRVFG